MKKLLLLIALPLAFMAFQTESQSAEVKLSQADAVAIKITISGWYQFLDSMDLPHNKVKPILAQMSGIYNYLDQKQTKALNDSIADSKPKK